MWLKESSLQDPEHYFMDHDDQFVENHAVGADCNLVCYTRTNYTYYLHLTLSLKKSAFTTTTTSTSNYIFVEDDEDNDDDDETSWTILESPDPPFDNQFKGQKPNPRSRPRIWKRKKGESAEVPVRPSEVPQREVHDDTTEPPAPPPINESPKRLRNFVRGLGKWKKGSLSDQWVCVEVTQKITQHYV
jgi:hypothetical protein